MAYVGYPTGSAQAPQSGLPGGAMVPYSAGGLGAPGTFGTSGQAAKILVIFRNY
jgi:hypothetical protein